MFDFLSGGLLDKVTYYLSNGVVVKMYEAEFGFVSSQVRQGVDQAEPEMGAPDECRPGNPFKDSF